MADEDLEQIVIELRGSNISDIIYTIANRIRDIRRPGITAPQASVDKRQGRITVRGMDREAVNHALQKAMVGIRGVKAEVVSETAEAPELDDTDADASSRRWLAELSAKERELADQRVGYEAELENVRKELEKATAANRALVEVKTQVEERARKLQEDYDQVVMRLGESVQAAPTSLSESVAALTEANLADVGRLNAEVSKYSPSGGAKVVPESQQRQLIGEVSRITGRSYNNLLDARNDLEIHLRTIAPEASAAKQKEDAARRDLKTIEDLDAGRITLSSEIEQLVRSKINVKEALDIVAKAEEAQRVASAGEETRRRIDDVRSALAFQERARALVQDWGRRHRLIVSIGVVPGESRPGGLMLQVKLPAVHDDTPLARALKDVLDIALDRKEYKDIKWEEGAAPKYIVRNGHAKTGRDADVFKAVATVVERIEEAWPNAGTEGCGVTLNVAVHHEINISAPAPADGTVTLQPKAPSPIAPPAPEAHRSTFTTGVRRAK